MASNEDSLGGRMLSRPIMQSRGVVEDGVIKRQAGGRTSSRSTASELWIWLAVGDVNGVSGSIEVLVGALCWYFVGLLICKRPNKHKRVVFGASRTLARYTELQCLPGPKG